MVVTDAGDQTPFLMIEGVIGIWRLRVDALTFTERGVGLELRPISINANDQNIRISQPSVRIKAQAVKDVRSDRRRKKAEIDQIKIGFEVLIVVFDGGMKIGPLFLSTKLDPAITRIIQTRVLDRQEKRIAITVRQIFLNVAERAGDSGLVSDRVGKFAEDIVLIGSRAGPCAFSLKIAAGDVIPQILDGAP